MNRVIARHLSVLAPLVLVAAFAAGCGGEKTDVSQGVDELNQSFGGSGVKIDCPKEVDGGEGTKFDCTLEGTGQSEKVELKVVKQGDDLAVDVADAADFQKKLATVAGAGQQQQGGGQGQGGQGQGGQGQGGQGQGGQGGQDQGGQGGE